MADFIKGEQMKKTLRGIDVIPAAFVAYAVANLVQSFFATEWMPVV
jgi:hypothetical protein